MYKIVNTNFIEYYSELVTKEKLNKYLIGATCNFPGSLSLQLKEGHKLISDGPYILPPIRWVESFEYYAEFKIICDVREVNENE